MSPRATYRQCTLERDPHQACPGSMIGLFLYLPGKFCPAAPASGHEAAFVVLLASGIQVRA